MAAFGGGAVIKARLINNIYSRGKRILNGKAVPFGCRGMAYAPALLAANLALHWAAYAKIRPHRRQLGRLKTMGD